MVDIGFCRVFWVKEHLLQMKMWLTLYVPEGQKWKLADIKSDMSNILLNGCEIENGAFRRIQEMYFLKIVISII